MGNAFTFLYSRGPPPPRDTDGTRYKKLDEQYQRTLDLPDASRYKEHNFTSQYKDYYGSYKAYQDNVIEGAKIKKDTYKWYDWVSEILPSFEWIRTYKPIEYGLSDLLAGIGIGCMVVPQAISYAQLAGVPPEYGLYGSFLPVIVYALFGSSRHLVVGPVAVTSNLISQMLVPIIPEQSENLSEPNNPALPDVQLRYNVLVTELAFVVSVIYTGVGVLRLGWLVNFLSHATISGFMTGAALQILLGQIQYIAGYRTAQGQSYEIIGFIFKNIRQFKWQEFLMGIIFLAILIAFRELSNKYKRAKFLKFIGPITVLILGIMVTGIGSRLGTIRLKKGDTPSSPIRLVGNVHRGPPAFTGRQIFPMDKFSQILPAAIVVAAIDFTESNSIATAIAVKGKYRIKYNKEIIGLGLANFMGTLFNSYTTTGSFSRSAVNFGAGAKTQASSIVSAIIVLFTLLFLTPMFQYVPYNAIGAIIIIGVSNLIEPERAWYYLKVSMWDFWAWIGAFLVTFFLGVEFGLLTAIGISLVVVFYHTIFPRLSELGEVDNTGVYRPITEYPSNIKTYDNILVFRPEQPLHFANVPNIRNKIRDILDRKEKLHVPIKYVVLDIAQTHRADVTVVHTLEEFKEELELYKIRILVANVQQKVLNMMEAANIPDYFGRKFIFATTQDAVNYCRQRLDFDRENPIEETESQDSVKKEKARLKAPNWANKFLPNRLFTKE